MKFYFARNLVSKSVNPCVPWDYKIVSPISDTVKTDKVSRQAWYMSALTNHQFYTGAEAVNPLQRISEANPVKFIHAFIYDVDLKHTEEQINGYVERLPHKPGFWERSLGGNWRMVYLLEEPLQVDGNDFGAFLCKTAAHKFLKVVGTIPGLDSAFGKPTQLYCNGGEWHSLGGSPLPRHLTQTFLMDCGREFEPKLDSIYSVPLDVAFQECQRKFPNMDWRGPFELESQGPSFWVEGSTSPMSAIVKEGGILTFAAHAEKMFYTWGDILGEDFCRNYRAIKLDDASRDVFYDGDKYWSFNTKENRWDDNRKEIFLNHLKVDCKISDKPDKTGLSPMLEVTNFIQMKHRIKGVCPNIFIRDQTIGKGDEQRLNTYVYNVPQPGTDLTPWGSEGGFPFISMVLDRLFDPPEQLPFFLSWWKTFYMQAVESRPCSGQNLFIQGVSGCGKSFTSRYLVGNSVGGFCDASSFVTGRDSFGGELYTKPLWCVDDELISTNDEARTKFASYMKMAASNNEHRYHVKFQRTTMVLWNGRIIVTLNDDSVSSRTLMHLDESTHEKHSFFQAQRDAASVKEFHWPNKTEVLGLRDAEMPFFLCWLSHYPIPAQVSRHPRFEICAYHAPSMMVNSSNASKSAPFKEVLIEVLKLYFKENRSATHWSGSGVDLIRLVHNYPDLMEIARQIKIEQVSRYLELIQREGTLLCSHSQYGNKRCWTFPRFGDSPPASPTNPPDGNFNDK